MSEEMQCIMSMEVTKSLLKHIESTSFPMMVSMPSAPPMNEPKGVVLDC